MNYNPNLNSLIATIFQATGKIFVPNAQSQFGENKVRAFEIAVSAEIYGFTLSENLLMALSNLNNVAIENVGKTILESLQVAVGANRVFQPMYPNFPKQVIDASDAELFVNAAMHYIGSWIGLRILPKYETIQRTVLENFPSPKIVSLCTEEDLNKYMQNMVTANVAYSEAQRLQLTPIALHFQANSTLNNIVKGSDIPNKENLAFWANYFIQNTDIATFHDVVAEKFATVTDVLRFVAAYSNGDTSLAATFKVAKLPRSIRKTILGLVESVCSKQADKDQIGENFLTYRSEWIRIAFACHASEYSRQYPQACEFIAKIRNNEKINTFNSSLEEAFSKGDVDSLITLLSIRPGVFARNLTRLLAQEKPSFTKLKKAKPVRTYIDTSFKNNAVAQQLASLKVQTVAEGQSVSASFEGFNQEQHQLFVDAFNNVAHKVSTPVLLQVHSHFKHIDEKMNASGRAIMPKGGVSKMFYQIGSIGTYDLALAKQIVESIEFALMERFSKLPALGYTYLDPELKNQNVPFAMRSASKALKTVARGSSFSVEDKNNIRLFLWWKEAEHDRCDIDLSASMFDENFNPLGHCSFWNLREGAFTHSGDIVSAPNGACEFIDIDRSKISENVAYVAMTLSSYTGQKYCDLPECFAGWMERDEDMQSGEVFDPRTLKNKVDLSSNTANIMPIVYDVRNNRIIWIDTSYSNGAIASNAMVNGGAISMILRSFVETHKPTLYDLFEMHAKARGTIISDPEKADHVFSIHNGVTPYDFDVIASEYMADAN